MLLQTIEINPQSTPSEIVLKNHHAVDVFRKYEIEYCCTGRWPLESVCVMKGVSFQQLKDELEKACQPAFIPPRVTFESWDIDFLVDYIVNVHHQYLKETLPVTGEIVSHFADEHEKKYPYMSEVKEMIALLSRKVFSHLQEEEQTVFPYVRQVAHAFKDNGSYGKLLVKTLRKPLENIIEQEQYFFVNVMRKIRQITNEYQLPEKACVSHKVALARLRELDNDFAQHVYLENAILFPRAIAIEKELLK